MWLIYIQERVHNIMAFYQGTSGSACDDRDEYQSSGIGYIALRLAMAQSIAEENQLKKEYLLHKIRFVVTEVGGNTKRDFQDKVTRAVFGAALNSGLIQKEPHEVHSLLHATEEAKRGAIVNVSSEANLAVKIAIIRREHWIAVAIFGESAIHPITGHERCGLGIMNI